MINVKKHLVCFLIFALCSFTFFVLKKWEIQPDYTIRFDGKFAHGTFSKLEGLLSFDPENLSAAKFDVTVDVASIDTGIELKNKHARSEKWLDAEHFPAIHFVSFQVIRLDTSYLVRGELEMHGIKKPVEIPFSFGEMAGRSFFYGKFKVKRSDFGIGKSTGKASDSTGVEIIVPVRAL